MHPRSRIFRVSYKLKAFHEAKLTSEPETDNEHDRFVVDGLSVSVLFNFFNFTSLWVIQVSFSAEYVRDVCAVVSDLSRAHLSLPSPSKK